MDSFFMVDKKLAWRLTAKAWVTQVLVFSGKGAGRNTAGTKASKRSLSGWGLGGSGH